MWALYGYNIELKGILTKTITITQSTVASPISKWKYNIIYETQKMLRKNKHPYTIICQSMKITVWLDKTFSSFTKLNPISDYGKRSGGAFADCIIIPFLISQKTLRLPVTIFERFQNPLIPIYSTTLKHYHPMLKTAQTL